MPAAIKLADNVYRIKTLGSFINSYAFINPDGSVALVDCGLKTAPKQIVEGLASIGKHPKDVMNVILTHAHDDHVGGAAEFISLSQAKEVSMHELDAPYVAAGLTPSTDTSTTAGRIMARISGTSEKAKYEKFEITKKLQDGDLIDVAGGISVIHTPGHTEGHISLLHLASQTLITGDSIWNMTSRLTWSFSGFCVNYQQSKDTAHRFLDLDFRNLAFTHGPDIKAVGKDRVKQFLSKKGIA